MLLQVWFVCCWLLVVSLISYCGSALIIMLSHNNRVRERGRAEKEVGGGGPCTLPGGGGGGREACIFNQQFGPLPRIGIGAVDWFYDFLNNFIELRCMYCIRDVSYAAPINDGKGCLICP